MGTIGLIQGLPNHIWYTWLDRFLPGKSLMTVGKKIVADQVICSPISSASFFVGAGMLEGCSMSEGWEEYKSKFLLVYIVSIFLFLKWFLFNFHTSDCFKFLKSFFCTDRYHIDWLHRLATKSVDKLFTSPGRLSRSLRQRVYRRLERFPLLR